MGITPAETTWTHHRARVAGLSRSREPNDPELIGARRAMRAERLKAVVERAVAEAPTFTPEQEAEIVAALRGGRIA